MSFTWDLKSDTPFYPILYFRHIYQSHLLVGGESSLLSQNILKI